MVWVSVIIAEKTQNSHTNVLFVENPIVKKILTPRFEVRDISKWRGHVATEMTYIGIWNKIYWTKQWLE